MSTATSPCPLPAALEAAAVVAEIPAELRLHLLSCSSCREQLERIRDDNRFLSDFAIGGALPPVAPPRDSGFQIDVPGYEIIREIRRGGQGVVYQAVQRSTKRNVAIKVMRQGPFATLADRARFDREVETLSRLDHPNIVTVHDAGVVSGFHYFVMNFIDGRPLDELPDWRSWVATLGELQDATSRSDSGTTAPLPSQKAAVAPLIRLFIKVCDAVHAAHLRGVIHRDLKPSNIRVDRSGEPFVLDFGLAKSIDAPADSAATQTGQFVGSLPWAAPEQVEGASSKIDLRTDVYALGAILYQLLTGSSPFDVGSNLRDAFDNILNREPKRPSALVAASGAPRIDDELDTIVLKCLSKDRERRYQSAGELARDLRLYLAGEPIQAKSDSAMYVLRKTLKRYRYRVVAASAFVVMLAVFSVVMAILYRRSAVLEQQATGAAESLADLLSTSNVEQGRLAGMLGNLEQAERLLWGELLMRRDAGANANRRLTAPPGPPQAYWALWELYRRRPCLRTLPAIPGVLRSAVPDADRRHLWVAHGADRLERLDETGECLEKVLLGRGPADRLTVLSADGRILLRPATDGWLVWPVSDRSAALELPGVNNSDGSAISIDGRGARVATAERGIAVVRELSSGRELARLAANEPLTAIVLSADGTRLAARDRAGGFYLYDVEQRTLRASVSPALPIREGAPSYGPLRFSPDGRRVADVWTEIAGRIWRLDSDPPGQTPLAEAAGGYRVQEFSPDGRLLAVGDLGGAMRIYDTESGARLDAFIAHAGRVRSICFTADGRLWTTDAGELRQWEIQRDGGVRIVRTDADRLHAVSFTCDGRTLLTAGGRGILHRLDLATFQLASRTVGDASTICEVACTRDAQHFAVATYGKVAYIWSAAAPDEPPQALPHPAALSHLCFSPDGSRLATAADDRVVRIWRCADGELEREWRGAADRIPQLAFNPTGERLAAAIRNGAVLVWDVASGECATWRAAVGSPLRTVRFSADGRWLAAAGAERTVHLWNAATGQAAAALVGHNQEIYSLDISHDGTLIASGDTGGVIRLWHLGLRRPLAALDGHSDPVMSLSFSPDDRRLASASLDGSLRVWDLQYYARHIAGNVESQLERIDGDEIDAAGAAAWRAWARAVMARD